MVILVITGSLALGSDFGTGSGYAIKKEGYGTMKAIMKLISGFVAVTFIMIVVIWGIFVYVSDYKVAAVDFCFTGGSS